MKLVPVLTFEINDPEKKQFHRVVLLKSGIIVGLFSKIIPATYNGSAVMKIS